MPPWRAGSQTAQTGLNDVAQASLELTISLSSLPSAGIICLSTMSGSENPIYVFILHLLKMDEKGRKLRLVRKI